MRSNQTSTTKTTNTAPAVHRAETADDELSVLGALPLLPGEDRAGYERLRAAIIAAMKPTDIMEKIWTNDVIYLECEIVFFRRAKANFIKNLSTSDRLQAAINKMRLGEDPHANIASMVAANIGTLEQLDAAVAKLELRRNNAYHEAEQHRARLGERLRQAIAQVEDAEFRELEDQTSKDKHAA
jgi:hypothetical protein